MKQNFHRILRLISAVVPIAAAGVFFGSGKFTAAAVLARLPRRTVPAAFLLIGLYLLKSLSFFFPLAVLQAACGAVFPFWSAAALNLCGTAAAMLPPWLLGRRSSPGCENIQRRFPLLQKAQALRPSRNFLYVLFLRAAGFFPFDGVSLYLGALKIPPGTYFSAGLLGCLPHLLLATALGAGLAKPSSGLLPAVGIGAALCVAALTLRRIVRARTK